MNVAIKGKFLVWVKSSVMGENIFFTFLLRSVMYAAESKFSNFVIEYLDEIETIFENISHLLVRVLNKLIGEKIWFESLCTHSF